MEQTTFRVQDGILEHANEQAEENDTNRSEVLRSILEKGMKYDDTVEELESRLDDKEACSEELRNQSTGDIEYSLLQYQRDFMNKFLEVYSKNCK